MELSPALVNVTADAAMQAYIDYAGSPVTPPDGYASLWSSFYGWEGLDPASPAIAKKFAIVFRSIQTPGQFLVAFRGTETPDEWIANAAFPTAPLPGAAGIGVEAGFLDVYAGGPAGQVPPPLRTSLFAYLQSVTVTELIVTGHSLGGALAALFAFDAATNLKIAPTLVTYACPNVGKAPWGAAFNAAVADAFRIYNSQDIVPFLPPANLGYVAVGANREVTFNPQSVWDRVLPAALLTNHSLSNYGYVASHAVLNNPPTWAGPFPDQSTYTSWTMQSVVPTPTATPLGLTMAQAHLEFLAKLKSIHGL